MNVHAIIILSLKDDNVVEFKQQNKHVHLTIIHIHIGLNFFFAYEKIAEISVDH